MTCDMDLWRQIITSYLCVLIWMVSSGSVVLHNKWLMSVFDFHFPATMTMMHMTFCFVVAAVLIRGFNVVDLPRIDQHTFVRSVLPIGALYSVVLVCSNYAYMYLTVAFIQMIKAALPILVLFASVMMGVTVFKYQLLWTILIISIGVVLVTEGQVKINLVGFFLQLSSLVFEATRLVMIEVLLKRRGINLNPLTTIYYVAPVALVCVCLCVCVLAFVS